VQTSATLGDAVATFKELGISRPLPLGKAVDVRFTPKKTGTLRYACAMDMIAGELVVQ